jgi:hypothetical protein
MCKKQWKIIDFETLMQVANNNHFQHQFLIFAQPLGILENSEGAIVYWPNKKTAPLLVKSRYFKYCKLQSSFLNFIFKEIFPCFTHLKKFVFLKNLLSLAILKVIKLK